MTPGRMEITHDLDGSARFTVWTESREVEVDRSHTLLFTLLVGNALTLAATSWLWPDLRLDTLVFWLCAAGCGIGLVLNEALYWLAWVRTRPMPLVIRCGADGVRVGEDACASLVVLPTRLLAPDRMQPIQRLSRDEVEKLQRAVNAALSARAERVGRIDPELQALAARASRREGGTG